MKIIHVNAQRKEKVTQKFFDLCQQDETICSITEPNEKKISEIYNINTEWNGSQVITNSDDLIKETIKTKCLDIVAIKIRKYDVTIISMYIRPWIKGELGNDQICTLNQLIINRTTTKIILMGDFNTSLTYWQKNKTTQHQASKLQIYDQLLRILKENELIPISSEWKTTYKRTEWVIDMIFVQRGTTIEEVKQIETDSDHWAISCTCTLEKKKIENKNYKYKHFGSWLLTKRTIDWETGEIGWDVPCSSEITSTPENGENWTKNHPIVKRCHEIMYFPDKHAIWKTKKKKKNQFQRLLKERKNIMKKKFKTEEDEKHLHEIRQKIEKKRKGFNLIRQMKTKNSKTLWNLIRKYLLQPQLTIDWTTKTSQESKTKWLENFTKKRPRYQDKPRKIKGELSQREEKILEEYNTKSSSLSSDNFTNKTWMKFYGKNKKEITEIIREIFKISHIPNIITVFGCGFVPKPNGTVRMVRSPNHLLKMIDKILSERLQEIAKEFLLPETQYGFQKGIKREDYFRRLMEKDAKEAPILIQLDISTAFDTVSLAPIRVQLTDRIGESTMALIDSMNKNHWLTYHDGKQKFFAKPTSEIAQGTSIGPLLFIFALDHCIRKWKEKEIKTVAYADDIIIIVEKQTRSAQSQITEIKNDLKEINLELNEKKTNYIMEEDQKLHEIVGYKYSRKKWPLEKIKKELEINLQEKTYKERKINWPKVKFLPGNIQKLLVINFLWPTINKYLPLMMYNNHPEHKIIELIGTIINKFLGQKNNSRWTYWMIEKYPIWTEKWRIETRIWNYNKTGENGWIKREWIPSRKYQHRRREKENHEIRYKINPGKNSNVMVLHNDSPKVWRFNWKKTIQQYELEVIALETIIKTWGQHQIGIKLSETTQKYYQGTSNFAKDIQRILLLPGKWTYWDEEKTTIDWGTREIGWDVPCSSEHPTAMEQRRKIAKEERAKTWEIFEKTTSPLNQLKIEKGKSLNIYQKGIIKKMMKHKINSPCCGENNPTQIHKFKDCNWIQQKYPTINQIMEKEIHKWGTKEIKIINEIIEINNLYNEAFYFLTNG